MRARLVDLSLTVAQSDAVLAMAEGETGHVGFRWDCPVSTCQFYMLSAIWMKVKDVADRWLVANDPNHAALALIRSTHESVACI
jgi:hypothetical protein